MKSSGRNEGEVKGSTILDKVTGKKGHEASVLDPNKYGEHLDKRSYNARSGCEEELKKLLKNQGSEFEFITSHKGSFVIAPTHLVYMDGDTTYIYTDKGRKTVDSSKGCLMEKNFTIADGMKEVFKKTLPPDSSPRWRARANFKDHLDFLNMCSKILNFDDEFIRDMKSKLEPQTEQSGGSSQDAGSAR